MEDLGILVLAHTKVVATTIISSGGLPQSGAGDLLSMVKVGGRAAQRMNCRRMDMFR